MEKVLIIQTAFIGDAVLTLPMIQKLKEMFPADEIDVLAIPATKEIFSASPYVDNVIIIDKKNEHKSLISFLKFSKKIKKNNYNKIYSPHRSVRSAIIVMLAGVRETYGFSNSSFKHVYKNLIEYFPDHHEVHRNLDLIGYKDEWRIIPIVEISHEGKEKVGHYFKNINFEKNICAIAPGSIWNTKKYPKEYFEKVIEYLRSRYFKVILIGGKKEKILCEEIANKFDNHIISSAGYFNLIESVEALRRCELLISNDSAPAHLGICADIPVLTLYCSTVPDFGFYPYNKKSSYLSYDDLSCKPCGIHGYEKCPLSHFACGRNLNPQMVISKINNIIYDDNKGN